MRQNKPQLSKKMQILNGITEAKVGKFQSPDFPIKEKKNNISKRGRHSIKLECLFETVFNVKDPVNEVVITQAMNTSSQMQSCISELTPSLFPVSSKRK